VAPPRVLTTVRVAASSAVAGLAALLLLLAPATHAYAEPTPADVEKQIDAKWNELEPLIEQYNTVHTQLTANKGKASQLQEQLAPLQLQVDMALSKVSDLAVNVYKGGPGSTFNAILAGGGVTSLADQLTLLDMVARNQKDQIGNVAAARDRYAADKKALDAVIAQQSKQDADLAAHRKQIESQINDLQKMRQVAYGSGGPATGALKPAACPVEYVGGAAGTAATKACSLIGRPYHWGDDGRNGGYDCSGLVMAAWGSAGVRLPHSSQSQKSQTKRITRAQLRTGDLVFFYADVHHVGLYVGGGWMVHAPNSGDVVRMALIDRHGGSISGYGRP
jgi:cell wall-associated NlpC family hydrolase